MKLYYTSCVKLLIKELTMTVFGFTLSREKKNKAKESIKSGYDKNGMPFIDMSDPKTAQIFKKRLRSFKGIKTA